MINNSDALLYESRNNGTIFVTTKTNRVTIASVTFSTGEYQFNGTGTSKRMNGDSRNPALGKLIATAEALKSLLAQVQGAITEEMLD